jgi:hypothetical protein
MTIYMKNSQIMTTGARSIVCFGILVVFVVVLVVASDIFPRNISSFFLSNNVMAFAFDNTKDDSIQVSGNPKFSAGGSTVMNYWIEQIGNDCDVNQNPITLNVNVASSEVTASPGSLTFEACSKPQSVTFTSSKTGIYSVTVTAPPGYKTTLAAFMLYVLPGPAKSGAYPITGTNRASSSTTSPAMAPPTLYLPPQKTYVEATNSVGAIVPYTVTALDSLGHRITPTCSHSSGSVFPLGTTKVTCTAKDASGNTQSGSFEIVVQDTTPPDLSIPSTTITAEATS